MTVFPWDRGKAEKFGKARVDTVFFVGIPCMVRLKFLIVSPPDTF